MNRPTALIHRFLIVEALQDSMSHELAQIREQLRVRSVVRERLLFYKTHVNKYGCSRLVYKKIV
ncbi:MAG: hypothetical protein OWR52_00115 [Acidibacillus sp.]|nr:hypothetical protein [Acidibacillus sp.]